ncbi:MAG TPA: enoyl-CoA hydratase-related protein [Cyclobacteriaceae bacterium]|nr:enoyl-CoA hydratase-related protein [Cyclobacteriaceae bacterium]
MSLVLYNTSNRIASITLNREEKRNALSPDLVQALKDAFDRAAKDDEAKVIILKGGKQAFCAGADLAYLQSLQSFTYEENLADSHHLKELFLKIYTHPKVVIAQVEGPALAGGCGLANVCDFCFAVPEAKFGFTEVKIGFIPAMVMVFLIRKIGESNAKQLLLSGKLIDATEARRMALVHEVYEADKIEDLVNKFAASLVKNNSLEAMQMTKRMIGAVQDLSLDEALQYTARMNAEARASDDCKK